MKNTTSMVTIWIVIISLLITGGYALGFFVYKDYEQNFNEQAKLTMSKFESLEDSLRDFSVSFENAIDANQIERNKVLSEIEDMKDDFQDLKSNYNLTASELKESIKDLKIDRLTRMIENLQGEINEFKVTIQDLDLKIDGYKGKTADLKTGKKDTKSVDLGKISIGKRSDER